MKCEHLTNACRKCGVKFDSHEKDKTCPECGEDRACHNEQVPGYRWCSVHGGPSPERGFYGLGRPVSTGQGSSFQITRLASKYNQIKRDGRLLSNRASMEIVRHRIEQLAERIDLNDAPERMKNLGELWQDYKKLRDVGLLAEASVVSQKIDSEFEAAYHDYMAWKQMFEALDLDRKMVESEVKIMKDIQAIITAEDAYQLSAKLLGAVMNVVTDPKQLKQIQWEFARLVGEQPEPRASRSGGEIIDSE